MVENYPTCHFLLVRDDGTICMVLRQTGPFEKDWKPLQMLDERGRTIRQPYPDPKGKQRMRAKFLNIGIWFIDVTTPPPGFHLVDITEAQFDLARRAHVFWQYDFFTRDLRIRPGHIWDEERQAPWPLGCRDLWIAHFADGGRPVYQVNKYSNKHPEDFPELLAAGLFHPWWKQPTQVEIHSQFRVKHFAVADYYDIAEVQRQRVCVAPHLYCDYETQPPTLKAGLIAGVSAS